MYYTLHEYPISVVLGLCIAVAPDPAMDYLVYNLQDWNSSNGTWVQDFYNVDTVTIKEASTNNLLAVSRVTIANLNHETVGSHGLSVQSHCLCHNS